MTTGKRDGGLCALDCSNFAFISALKNKNLHASFDLWLARLGHVKNNSFIYLLNKKGHLYLTSLLSSLSLFRTHQLAKIHFFPYSQNEHRASYVLDLIHCNI